MASDIEQAGGGTVPEPIRAKGYGYTVTFGNGVITIDRNHVISAMYGFAKTVAPVGSIVDVSLGKATILTNGLFCLSVRTMDGDSPLITSAAESRKSPYCAIYIKQREREFRHLYEAVKAALPSDPLPIAYDQTPETLYMRQMRVISAREGKNE